MQSMMWLIIGFLLGIAAHRVIKWWLDSRQIEQTTKGKRK